MGIFTRLSHISRKVKRRLFFDTLKPKASDLILELGASGNAMIEEQILGQYPWPSRVVAANLYLKELKLLRDKCPEVLPVVCDAAALPFRDDTFDIVYSNAVIEHLPTPRMQELMAEEMIRCGKRWFISTPNKWFPFEFHARLPFVSWFSGTWVFNALLRIVCWDHVQTRYKFRPTEDIGVRLLSARALRRLFPFSRITKVRITIWPETLIATGPEHTTPEP